MAALVAGALCQIGDRPAWLAAILSDRYGRPMVVIAAALLALAAASAIAVIGATLIAPTLTPNARQLLLGLALAAQGSDVVTRAKAPDRLTRWKLGAALTSLVGLFILLVGDGLQFVVLALATRTAVPALAGIGAVMGALAVIAPAALMGEAAWRRLPLELVRRVIGGLFLLAAAVLALGAFGLV